MSIIFSFLYICGVAIMVGALFSVSCFLVERLLNSFRDDENGDLTIDASSEGNPYLLRLDDNVERLRHKKHIMIKVNVIDAEKDEHYIKEEQYGITRDKR